MCKYRIGFSSDTPRLIPLESAEPPIWSSLCPISHRWDPRSSPLVCVKRPSARSTRGAVVYMCHLPLEAKPASVFARIPNLIKQQFRAGPFTSKNVLAARAFSFLRHVSPCIQPMYAHEKRIECNSKYNDNFGCRRLTAHTTQDEEHRVRIQRGVVCIAALIGGRLSVNTQGSH